MVYTATTPELYLLEYMVHLEETALAGLPPLILCEIIISDDSITFLTVEQLPSGWNDPEATPVGLAEFVEQMFSQHQTLCLALPLAVVPLSPSRNVLLNPLHQQRAARKVVSVQSYPIDPRLPTATRH